MAGAYVAGKTHGGTAGATAFPEGMGCGRNKNCGDFGETLPRSTQLKNERWKIQKNCGNT